MNERPEMSRNTGAFILIGLGVLFLAAQIFNFSFIGSFWPLIIVAAGLPFLFGAINGGKNNAGLIFPGLIISGTGLILVYQNFTNHWGSWAYAWTLYPVFVGAGLWYMGRRTGDNQQYRTGQNMVRWGITAFAGFWVLFEVIIFGGGDRLFGSLLLPIILIGAGLFLLFRRNHDLPAKRKVDTYTEYKPKRQNGYRGYSDDLQSRIDAALAEPDDVPTDPEPTKPADPSLN